MQNNEKAKNSGTAHSSEALRSSGTAQSGEAVQNNGAAHSSEALQNSGTAHSSEALRNSGAVREKDTATKEQESGEFRYDAFISYRHAPLDQYVAQTLQRRLESFRVPRLADRETKELGKKSIRRIFRDRDELPLAGNLSEPIMEALSSSENLIVICSPRILESQWCRREIETFIALRGMDHVFAVLIEGEPNEAFPEPLRVIKKEVTEEDGSVTVQEIPVEPLAADVRGNSKAEVSKKIRQEMLRLAAPMLGCSYDDLRQRHKMRRLKRMLVSAAVIAGALFLFGAVSTYQAFRIKKQSDHIAAQSEEIMTQSEEILAQSEEIMAQSEEIQAQAQSLYAFQSRSLSETALQLYESGDRVRALLVALEGIPEDLEHPDRPIVSQSEAALAEILQVYANGSEHRPFALLEHDAQTRNIAVSPSGARLVSVDSMGQLYCWDMNEGTLLVKGKEMVGTAYDIAPVFLDEERILFVSEDGIVCLDSADLSECYAVHDLYAVAMAVSPDRRMFAVAQNRYEVGIYDAADGTLIACYEDGQQMETIGWDLTFSEDSTRVLFEGVYENAAQNDSGDAARGEDAARVISVDVRTGAVLMEYQVPHRYISSITCTADGVCYIIAIGSITSASSGFEIGQSLTCFEADGRVRWEIDDEESKGGPVRFFEDMVVYKSGSDVYMVSQADGSTVQELHYPAEVLRLTINAESRLIAVTLANGTMQFDVLTDLGVVSRTYLESANEWMLDVASIGGTMILQPRASNRVYLYRLALGANARETADTGKVYYRSAVDGGGRLYLYDYDGYLVYDMFTDEVLYQYDAAAQDENIRALLVMDEGFAVITADEVRVYDGVTGEQVGKTEHALYSWELLGKDLYFVGYGGHFGKMELPSCQVTELLPDFRSDKLLLSAGGQFVVSYDGYKRDQCTDLTSGEVFELPTTCRLMAADAKGETYLAADQEMMQLARFRFGDREPVMRMDAQLAFIKNIGFSPDGNSFFVCYEDNRLEIYDADSFTLRQSYRDLDGISEWKALDGGRTLLCGEEGSSAGSFILDADYNVVYRIPRCKAVFEELQKVYTLSGTTLYAYPLYDLEQLVGEAWEVLGDVRLSPEERRIYYIE